MDRFDKNNLIHILWFAGKYEPASQIFEIRKQELLRIGLRHEDQFRAVFLSPYNKWLAEKRSSQNTK